MQICINLLVVKVLIDDPINVHQVLDEGFTEWQRRSDLLPSVVSIGHLEGELTHAIDAVGSLLIVFMEYAEGVVLPVELRENVVAVLFCGEVLVALEEIDAMDAKRITVLEWPTILKRVLPHYLWL